MEPKKPKEIDAKLRDKIRRLAQNYFDTVESPTLITKVNVDVLVPNQINYKEYVSSGKGGLKRFLELFPDIFLLDEQMVNSGLQVFCTYNNPSIAQIEIILSKLLAANGDKYFLAQIPLFLKNKYNIDYKTFSAGKTFKVWLESEFSHRFVAEGEYLLLIREVAETDPLISQMRTISSMSWWNDTPKSLHKYTKQSKTPEEWSSIVARNFAYALAGISELYCYELDGITKIVFNTGIKSEHGNSVYCIMQSNQTNASAGKFKYCFVGFCCVLEDDNEICSELKENLPELSKAESPKEDRYEKLRNILSLLVGYQNKLDTVLPETMSNIREGKAIADESFALIKSYHDMWNYISEFIEDLGWEAEDDKPVSVEYIEKRLEYSSRRKDIFSNAAELFVAWAEKIIAYCDSCGLNFMVDIIREDINTIEKLTVDSHLDFKAVIGYYQNLIEITNYNEIELAVNSIEAVQKHFGSRFTLPLAKLAFLGMTCETIGIEDKNTPSTVSEMISALDKITEVDESSEEPVTVDADELLDKALSSPDAALTATIFSWAKYFYSTKLEKAIVAADFDKCRTLAESDVVFDTYGKTSEQLLTCIDNLESNCNSGMTLYEIANRLLAVIGNYNQTAEKILILGLITDPKQCGQSLVDLYISENDSESFCKVWEKYGHMLDSSSRIVKQILRALAMRSEHDLMQYIKKNISLIYNSEYASLICDLSEENGYTKILDICKARLEYVESLPEINAFEKQILEYDYNIENAVMKAEVSSSSALLESLGYSSTEIEHMINSFSSVEIENVKLSAVARLYNLQANKNGTVERVLWQDLLNKYDEDTIIFLLNLLCDSERYSDVCLLFECYEESISGVQKARSVYLRSLCKSASERFYEFACKDFQECIALISQGAITIDDIAECEHVFRENGAEREAEFCSHLIDKKEYYNDAVVRSIITISNGLRELAIDSDKLVEFGLNTERADKFVSVYKTDGYTRDRSILGAAYRMYSLIGADCNTVTRDLAIFAQENGFDALSLLWSIYSDIDDNSSKLYLLQSYPEYQVGREQEMCTLLLKQNKYEDFLRELPRLDNVTPEQQLQKIIAKCRLNMDISEDLSSVSNIHAVSSKWVIETVATMFNAGLIHETASFVASHFEEALENYSEQEIYAFVTGGGTIGEDGLKAIQKASVAEAKKLAIYIYEIFGIGRMKLASRDLFTNFLANYSGIDEKVACQMRVIYAKNEEYLTKIILNDISNMFSTITDKELLQQKVEAIVENTLLPADGVLAFLDLAKTHDLSITPNLCKHIIRMCENADIQSECIDFFNSNLNVLIESKCYDIMHMLCQLYNDAFSQGTFKDEWIENAAMLCYPLINKQYFYSAQYCLFHIEKARGNHFLAKSLLFMLLEKKHVIPFELLSAIEEEAHEMQLNEFVTLYDLFIEMAEVTSLRGILDYCELLGRFIDDKASLIKYYNDILNNENAETYSVESCVVLLKLVFSDPENPAYWEQCQKMPLEKYPAVYSKILYRISLLDNKDSKWKRCIDACERYAQEELLADVLIDCVRTVPVPFGLHEIRIALADKVNTNPAYFAQFNDEKLKELATILVERLDESSSTIMHNAIRDISLIVVSTDSPETLKILVNHLDNYLFGEHSNLGFALACRLIIRKRFDESKEILTRLTALPTVKYKKLIVELANMDVSEISSWASKRVNSELLDIILPDGNYPAIQKLNDLTLAYSCPEKAEDGALLMSKLLDDMPDDYCCYMALFMLCKQLPCRIDMLHKALCGLIKNDPGNSKSYYSRSRKDFAILLARINAVVFALNKTEEISKFDGYDFRITAREFYQKYENRLDDLSSLTDIQTEEENVRTALANQSAESTEIICELIYCGVTGDWKNLLIKCWFENIDISTYINYFSDYSAGLVRSILESAYSLEEEEQKLFIDWVVTNIKNKCRNIFNVSNQAKIAVYLYSKGYYTHIPQGVFEENILSLPFEERSVYPLIFRNTVLQIISKAPGYVFPCAVIASYLAYSSEAMSECWQTAMRSFEASNDLVAHGLFSTLNLLMKEEKISHREDIDPRRAEEMYESMMRVSGIFSRNEKIIAKISSPTFHSWSCINMVMALLCTVRANEVNRLKSYFSRNNLQITDAILMIIDKSKSDDMKIEAISSLHKEVDRGLLCFWTCKGSYTFLSNASSVAVLRKMHEEIAIRRPNVFWGGPKYLPKHFLWIDASKIHSNAYQQIEVVDSWTPVDAVEVYVEEEKSPCQMLSFVADLAPITDSANTIEELWEAHESINSFGLENYQKRLELSKQIYQMALGENITGDQLNDYVIRYGLDCYFNAMAHKQYANANSLIFEMVGIYNSAIQLDGNRSLKNTVCITALHELLYRGYSSIRTLVDAYVNHKSAFIKMRNMLPASTMSVELNDVNAIYSALEIIAKCMSEISESHSSAYRVALDSAKKPLGDISQIGWSHLKSVVRQMIQEEINKIAQRPILSPVIISKTAIHPYGYIFGMVENIGTDTAENITIQLDYTDGTSSKPYTLPKLEKGEIAAFEISYSAPRGTSHLEYDVNVLYENKGEKYSHVSLESLNINEAEYKDYPFGIYITDRAISDFELMEDGTVHSDNFFGRDEEKRKINSIFAGTSFTNYKNIIIKGIRRAGKTSILYYLLKYANLKYDNVVAVYTTCEGVKGERQPIQNALINRVMNECKKLNVGNISEEEWNAFVERWKLPDGAVDREADDLQYFYRDLKDMNGGKGLMLIIDEFDILIEEVEQKQGVYNTLLPSLRILLNSVYCQEAVHLVLCGSNKLIRYMDGGTLNQLFQQFGDNVVEIGKLLERDMKKMLEAPYQNYPNVKISDEAIKWIWKYTNGLVWYSKLIANCALNRARGQERYVVYPTDVIDAVYTVISHHDYFKSLVTSCRPNELKVLDAMQSLTAKATQYVSLSELLNLLACDFSQRDIESIINTLEMMQVVQRNPYDRSSYRFAVELYWHYFRVSPSNYERTVEATFKFVEGEDLDDEQTDGYGIAKLSI